jgi:hypothetical protein
LATDVKTPVITGQPQAPGSNYAFGATATALSVTANGTSGTGDLNGTLTYQWYTTSSSSVYDITSPIGSETGTAYTPLTTTAGTLYYYVKVTSTNTAATGTTVKTLDSSIVEIAVNGASIPSVLYADTDLTTAIDITAQSGDTVFAKALKWLENNAASGTETAYTIILPSDETESPANTLSAATFKSGAQLTLKGTDTTSVIQLTGTGSLFTLAAGSNITLMLDENITLKGVSSNTAALVGVYAGCTLEMRGNAKITGNTSLSAGGVEVYGDGTFTMNDNASVSGNTDSSFGGGGVEVAGNGTFTMNDNASVSDNKSTKSS